MVNSQFLLYLPDGEQSGKLRAPAEALRRQRRWRRQPVDQQERDPLFQGHDDDRRGPERRDVDVWRQKGVDANDASLTASLSVADVACWASETLFDSDVWCPLVWKSVFLAFDKNVPHPSSNKNVFCEKFKSWFTLILKWVEQNLYFFCLKEMDKFLFLFSQGNKITKKILISKRIVKRCCTREENIFVKGLLSWILLWHVFQKQWRPLSSVHDDGRHCGVATFSPSTLTRTASVLRPLAPLKCLLHSWAPMEAYFSIDSKSTLAKMSAILLSPTNIFKTAKFIGRKRPFSLQSTLL